MKLIVCSALALSILAAMVIGQNGVTPPTDSQEPSEPKLESKIPTGDPATVEKAEQVLQEVSKAYKDAKALTDAIEFKVKTPEGEQEQNLKITIGSGTDAKFEFPPFELTAVDGKLHIVREDIPDKYFAKSLEGDMGQTLKVVLGEEFTLPFQFILRQEDATVDEKVQALAFGMMQQPRLTGHQMGTNDNGEQVHQILFASENGKGVALVDEKSKLVERVETEVSIPTPMGPVNLQATVKLSPQAHDSLPTAIAFAPGDRKMVEKLEDLEPTAVKVGDMAPDFSLPTLDGQTVTLSSLRGNVVVLDFWATWCGPCVRSLPALQEFATWAEQSGQPIKVYPVNVSERTKTEDERKQKVGSFWTKAKYAMPTLIDINDKVFPQYGFSGIPASVIIDPQGRISATHVGADPKTLVETLKKDVEEALKTTG